MAADRMKRVSRAAPCPVCGKPDWCLVANDGSAAICARIEEGSIKKCGDAGYLHILGDRHDRHDGHKRIARRRHLLKRVTGVRGQAKDFDAMAQQCQVRLTAERLDGLARALDVSGKSLRRLGIGWDGRAYTFPMTDADGGVIGIRQRFPNGGKASVRGGKNGLFVPAGLGEDGRLLVCEGPTDTAAASDLGFDAIGRPNCNSLVEMTARAARNRAEIVIVADNDKAGRYGATRLAHALALHYPCVRVVVPPDGVKDLRQWLRRGLTAETLTDVIAATTAVKLKVTFSRTPIRKGVRR